MNKVLLLILFVLISVCYSQDGAQTCPGTPVCGGASQGKCLETGKCVCTFPWEGISCDSKSIDPSPPVINNTSPSVDLDFNFQLFIHLESLVEIDVNGAILKKYPLTSWVLKQNTPTNPNIEKQYILTTSINNSISTNITCTMDHYIKQENISFANYILDMQPNTLKLTIEISAYDFSHPLNSLQLLMSTSLPLNNTSSDEQENQEDISFEIETVSEGIEFAIISFGSYTLRSRYVRKGILDERVTSVRNTFEKSVSGNEIKVTAVITAPYYIESLVIDPDFAISKRKADEVSISSKMSIIYKLPLLLLVLIKLFL